MAQNPSPSRLDPHQILQRSFQESDDRLRVDAVASIDSGTMEVVISDVDDSIKIGDGANGPYLNINTDGSINVSVTEQSNESEVISYGEITAIASAVETTILTYTVPASVSFHLHRVLVSGDNIANYRVKINGTTKSRKRTWWTQFNEVFEFLSSPKKGIKLTTGNTVQVTVIHNSPMLGEFNASIQGVEIT